MTSHRYVYLTVNSYVEAFENASRLITFEVSHQVARESEQRNFAIKRTLKIPKSDLGLASTARRRRTGNITSDPPRSPGLRLPAHDPNRVLTPHAKIISRSLPAAPRPWTRELLP